MSRRRARSRSVSVELARLLVDAGRWAGHAAIRLARWSGKTIRRQAKRWYAAEQAARYAQAARAIGLTPRFHDHGVGDLGGGPENSVAIWNVGGQAGSGDGRQDLEITNTTGRNVTFRARDLGGAVAIVASVEGED